MNAPTPPKPDSQPPQRLPGTDDNAPNPYPWLKPMPLMWLCVIICIVLIVIGSMLNQKP